MAKKQFKAESKRLLDLMIHSIYTHKEIFLREIISNASDAIDKLCYLSLTDENVGLSRQDFHIRLSADEEKREITVSDNGIGMTRDELESSLGVIARSGSLDFKSKLGETAQTADIDIIGQFGVGFYSAFMVAERVTVISRAYGADTACRWESEGADGYTIAECQREAVGTDVIMHLKPDTQEENYSDFLTPRSLKSLVKKYSDYIRWPILMADKEGKDETLNSMVPIWQRPKDEVSDEEAFAFYKELTHDYADPASVIRVNAEGLFSYRAMLFIPSRAPFDFYSRGYEPGLSLYSSGVMIMEKCADLLPDCFRFVRGVVDSQDLSLNISREILQHDRQLKVISGNLEKKIRAELLRLLQDEREKYETVYRAFGLSLKFGLIADYGLKKDTLKDLLLFYSNREKKLISLSEYVKSMQDGQKMIYYACGESAERAVSLPQAEPVLELEYDLLCLTDDVDEFVMQTLREFEGKRLCNVSADDLDLPGAAEKTAPPEESAETNAVLSAVKSALGDAVSDVRLSEKLRSHPVCLTAEGDVSLEMEKYFSSLPNMGQTVKANRVLELNAAHPAFQALREAAADPERLKTLSEILLAQAELIAGLPLQNPSAYTDLVCSLF